MTARMIAATAALSAGRMGRSSGFAVAIAECLDLYDAAVFESHAPHQHVGTEIVNPAFDRNFDLIVGQTIGTAVQPSARVSPSLTRREPQRNA
jgi:hypothetical protein